MLDLLMLIALGSGGYFLNHKIDQSKKRHNDLITKFCDLKSEFFRNKSTCKCNQTVNDQPPNCS